MRGIPVRPAVTGAAVALLAAVAVGLPVGDLGGQVPRDVGDPLLNVWALAWESSALVRAPASGVVRLVQPDLYFSGGTLIVDHGQGLSSTFIHLSEILVAEGDELRRGDPIARVGATGRATGPHLDWRMNWRGERIDPELVLRDFPAGVQTPMLGLRP